MFDAGVKVLFIFADDHHVHARVLGFHKGMIRNTGSHIRVKTEGLPHGYVQALEAPALWRGDRGLEKNSVAAQRVPRTWLDAGSVAGEIDFFTDVDSVDLQLRAGFFENLKRCLHDFRADSVTMCNRNWNCGHEDDCLSKRFGS